MQKKLLKATFNAFVGIDARNTSGGKESICDINNFRVTDDGALEKREGYKYAVKMGTTIRDIWSGSINGEFYCYFLSSKYVYLLDIENNSYSLCGSISSTSGEAKFFYYRDSLYLSESGCIYQISSNSVSPIIGYVPLYGKDWPTTTPGEINEPLNLMNMYARITYTVPTDFTSLLPTRLPVSSVISVYKNGAMLSSESYRYDTTMTAISVPGIVEGDKLSVVVLFKSDNTANNFISPPYATVFGGITNSRVFMWGNGNTIFPSTHITEEQLRGAEEAFPGCSPLYFKQGHQFIVGDGRYTVQAIQRHYDRLLIFTDGDAWMADSNSCGTDDLPIMNINSSFGCASKMGAAMADNDPITIGQRSILRWNSNTDELNECNAYSISEEINELLPTGFFKNAIIFKDPYRNEIWVHNSKVSNDVWIYSLKHKRWVRFSEISASAFFDANGSVGFTNAGDIYIFSREHYSDKVSGFTSKEIVASINLGILDFGSTATKRLSALNFKGSLDNGTVYVEAITDCNQHISKALASNDVHSIITRRLNSGRFYYLKSTIVNASGPSRQIIREIEIDAR